jgi:hypothetical protein
MTAAGTLRAEIVEPAILSEALVSFYHNAHAGGKPLDAALNAHASEHVVARGPCYVVRGRHAFRSLLRLWCVVVLVLLLCVCARAAACACLRTALRARHQQPTTPTTPPF